MSAVENREQDRPWRLYGDLAEPGYTVLLASALMLPAAGAITRTISIALAGIADSGRLAIALPLGELAGIGLQPILITALPLVYATFIPRILRPQNRSRATVPVTLAIAGVGVPLAAGVVGFPMALITYAMAGVAFWVGDRERWKPLRGKSLGLAVSVLYALTALAYGFVAAPQEAVTLTMSAGAIAGPYVRVAEDPDWLYLAPCSRDVLVQVRKTEIASISWSRKPSFDLLRRLTSIHPPDFFGSCP